MDQKLAPQIVDQLKQCSKDEASFSKLKELFVELSQRYTKIEKQLILLEQAIKHDYDSILITELNLEKPGPKIVYVNDGFTQMTGYKKEEVIGKTPRILQGEKTDRHVLERLKRRLIEGQAFFGHTVNYKKDGTEFINQWDIHPLTNKEGEITHWVSYQRDITERRETSKLIFDSNLDFDNLIEESKKTFIDLDVQGNLISSNNAFKNLLHYDADELKTVKVWDLVTEEDQNEVKSLFEDFDVKKVEEKGYQWNFETKKGETVRLEAKINYFVSNDETVIRVHFENLSMRDRIVEKLKNKKDKFENIANKKDEFVLRFVNENGKKVCKFVSDTFTNITGLNPDLVLNQGIKKVIHAENTDAIEEALEKAFNGSPSSINCRYKSAENGNYINVIQSFKPVYSPDNEQVESVKSVALLEIEIEN